VRHDLAQVVGLGGDAQALVDVLGVAVDELGVRSPLVPGALGRAPAVDHEGLEGVPVGRELEVGDGVRAVQPGEDVLESLAAELLGSRVAGLAPVLEHQDGALVVRVVLEAAVDVATQALDQGALAPDVALEVDHVLRERVGLALEPADLGGPELVDGAADGAGAGAVGDAHSGKVVSATSIVPRISVSWVAET
jgi:hypothetical protein